jgi:hypothetical protein
LDDFVRVIEALVEELNAAISRANRGHDDRELLACGAEMLEVSI